MKRTAALIAAVAATAPSTAEGHGKGCNTRDCDVRVAHDMSRRHKLRVVAPYREWLSHVARCESGGDWSTNTGNGFYGGLQFTASSWRAVGGRGMPQNASKLEQMFRAVLLLRAQGPRAWPVCSA